MITPKLLSKDELAESTADTYWLERLRAHVAALEADNAVLLDALGDFDHADECEWLKAWTRHGSAPVGTEAPTASCTCSKRAEALPRPGAALLEEHKAALADNAALLAWIDVWGHASWCEREHDKSLRCSEQCNASEMLSRAHPGAALLDELTAVRKECDWARKEHRKALVRARNEGLEKAAVLADNAAQGARLLRADMQSSVMRTAQDKAAETASDLAVLIRREKEPEE